jgi:RNA polymerase sigma-70 factor (ECF subfamily)
MARGHRPRRPQRTIAGITPAAADRTLVAAAQAGDRDALDTLLRRHHDRLWRLCRRMAGNDHDAADALQDALIAIARGIRRFDGRSAFTTWSYRVATNACLDELRRRRRRPVPGAVGVDVGEDDRPAPRPTPSTGDGGFEAVAERAEIDEALAVLPLERRAAVVLRDLCDLDYAEIARVLDIAPGTVRSRIARGRAQLADLLGNRADPPARPTPAP